MSSFVLDAISRLTGNEFLSRCLKLCEFDDFSELINIDENTLDKMEIFIQKKCAKMSLNERRIFIGDSFAENPDIFKFSPGIRQKFLNVMENLSKIFTTSNLPFSLFNLKEICHRYEINNRSAITSVPRNALKMVLANENLPTEFVNNIPSKAIAITDEPLLTDVNQGIVSKKPFEPYPNIFQRMDLLRKGEIEINENYKNKNIEKEKNILSAKNKENFITNKENKEQTEDLFKVKRVLMKRKADDDPDYQEPAKKKLHEYRKYNKKLKTFKKVKFSKSDSTDSSNSVPLRIKSQRLMDKCKVALEPKKTEEPTERVKRKYTKRVKTIPEQITMPENTEISISNSQLANGPTKFNEKENEELENPSSHKIYKVSKTSNEAVSTKLSSSNVKQLTASDAVQNLDVESINGKKSAEKLSTNRTSYLKILPNPCQNYGVRLIGPLNKNGKVFTKSLSFHKSLENFEKLQSQSKSDPNLPTKSDSIKLLLTESKNVVKLNEHLLKVPLNPNENPVRQINPVQNLTIKSSNAQNVIVQSKIINSSQLKVNIVSSPDTNQFNKPIQSNKPFDVNIQQITLSNKDQFNKTNQLPTIPQTIKPKLKLSDVPFQCFDVKKAPIKNRHINALAKNNNIQKISINPSVQQKNSNVDSCKTKMQSSIIKTNQLKVIQIPKITAGNQIIQPSKENFTDQINPIKSTSSSNFRFEPVKLFEKSIMFTKPPTIINSGGLEVTPEKINNFQQMMNNSIDFSMNPQWTSTPNFIANRFINATKHQKSNSESGKTVENKSQSASDNFVTTPKQYRY